MPIFWILGDLRWFPHWDQWNMFNNGQCCICSFHYNFWTKKNGKSFCHILRYHTLYACQPKYFQQTIWILSIANGLFTSMPNLIFNYYNTLTHVFGAHFDNNKNARLRTFVHGEKPNLKIISKLVISKNVRQQQCWVGYFYTWWKIKLKNHIKIQGEKLVV